MAAWMLHGFCFGEEAGAQNHVFFRVKWLQAAMKGTSCVRRVRLWSVCLFLPHCNGGTQSIALVCLRVRSYRVFWNLSCRSQWNGYMIVVIWCCHVCRYMRVSHVMLQNALYWLHECCMCLLRDAAHRIVMAASRLLGAADACVILQSFAAGDRKSYWSGCIKAATAICQQIFSILALVIFLVKVILKTASKSRFFCFGAEIRLWSCNSCCDYVQESFSV